MIGTGMGVTATVAAGLVAATGAGLASSRTRLSPAPLLVVAVAAGLESAICLTGALWYAAMEAAGSSWTTTASLEGARDTMTAVLLANGWVTVAMGLLAGGAGWFSHGSRWRWPRRGERTFGREGTGFGIVDATSDAIERLLPLVGIDKVQVLTMLVLASGTVLLPCWVLTLGWSRMVADEIETRRPHRGPSEPYLKGGVIASPDGSRLTAYQIIAGNTSQPPTCP